MIEVPAPTDAPTASDVPDAQATRAITVVVRDIAGGPLPGAVVVAGSTRVTADGDGVARWNAPTEADLSLSVTHASHAPGWARVPAGDAATVELFLTPADAQVVADPQAPATVVSDGIALDFPAGSMVDANGAPLIGPVDVQIAVVDGAAGQVATPPAITRSGGRLSSGAAFEVTISAGGAPANIGDAVPFTLQLDPGDPVFAMAEPALFTFDEGALGWEAVGPVSLDRATGTVSGELPHFTWFAIGQEVSADALGCASGAVQDASGAPIAGLAVLAVSATGVGRASTASDGSFCVELPVGEAASVRAAGAVGARWFAVETTASTEAPGVCADGCVALGALTATEAAAPQPAAVVPPAEPDVTDADTDLPGPTDDTDAPSDTGAAPSPTDADDSPAAHDTASTDDVIPDPIRDTAEPTDVLATDASPASDVNDVTDDTDDTDVTDVTDPRTDAAAIDSGSSGWDTGWLPQPSDDPDSAWVVWSDQDSGASRDTGGSIWTSDSEVWVGIDSAITPDSEARDTATAAVDSGSMFMFAAREGSATVTPGGTWVGAESLGAYTAPYGALRAWLTAQRDADGFADVCRVSYDLVDATSAGLTLAAAERDRLADCPGCSFAFAVVARNEQVTAGGFWDSGGDTANPRQSCATTGLMLGVDLFAPTTRQFYGFVENDPVWDDVWMRHDGSDWAPVAAASFDPATGAFAYRELTTYVLMGY